MSILATKPRPMQTDQPNRQSRTYIYKGIASLLWLQYCLEQGIQYQGFDLAPKDFQSALLDGAEAFANMALEPDLRDAALMCMADKIVEANYRGDHTITDLSRHQQQSYLATAEAGLQAFLLNLRTVPPDARYRDQMSRMIDALAPKVGVM